MQHWTLILLLLPFLHVACARSNHRAPTPRPSAPAPRPVLPAGAVVLQPSTSLHACVGANESRLFSTDEQGRIEARAIADGRVVWTVATKGELVHCDDDLVLTAHVTPLGALTLNALATADGKKRWSHSHAVPSWIDDKDMHVTVWRDQRGYGVSWSGMTYWRNPYPPTEQQERDAHREAKGAFVRTSTGETHEVRGPPFKQTKVPASIQKDFPGLQGRFTLDGAHVRFDDRTANTVVHLKTKARRVVPVQLGSAAAWLYLPRVPREGASSEASCSALLVELTHEEGERREVDVTKARCWDRQNKELWSAELFRQEAPEARP